MNLTNWFSRVPGGVITGLALVASVCSCSARQATAQEETESVPGIQMTQPESGRFIEVDGKFMVPYSATIPGTDVSFEMVPIAGGQFSMGSPESEKDRSEDEGPVVTVKVQPFWMGKYEVTWGEYDQYMALDEAFKKLHREGLRKITEENESTGGHDVSVCCQAVHEMA